MNKLSSYKSPQDLRGAIEHELGHKLTAVSSALVDDPKSIHTENVIGATSVPLGIAGPVRIMGDEIDGDYLVPLATTEGAMIASVSRGAKALYEAGGVSTAQYQSGTTRGPVFYTGSIDEGRALLDWIESDLDKLVSIASKTSKHLTLINIEGKLVGQYVYLRFFYDTQNAMGMNMATIATQAVVTHIEREMSTTCLAVAGNFDVDKKPSWLNALYGRGYQAWADVVIPQSVIESTLKTNAQSVFDTWLAKCMIGSALSGSMGFNAQAANIIAAMYIATGQDPAHVVEGSLAVTTMQVVNGNDLYASVYLPSVMVGVVGGGTGFKTQREALLIANVENPAQLSQLIAAGVLAGEVSLLASLATGTLAQSHEKLGR